MFVGLHSRQMNDALWAKFHLSATDLLSDILDYEEMDQRRRERPNYPYKSFIQRSEQIRAPVNLKQQCFKRKKRSP